MEKILRFDLDVDSSALLCPNPEEFFSKAYITSDVVDNFRVLPGIKYETKIANVNFPSLLKASTCSFTSVDHSLSAVTISVCPVSAMAEICQFDIEQSFLASQMPKGSNGNFTVASFMAYYWNEMASEIESEVELIRWAGDTSNPAYSGNSAFLALCDGYEKKLSASTKNINVTATTITTSNVIAEMSKVVQALPAALKNKKADLRFYVSSDIALAYELAAAAGNTIAYVTESLGLKFINIKIVVCEGMSSGHMVLTHKDNLIYAFDAEGDGKQLKAVNLADSVAEPVLRTRVNLKMGFYLVNEDQIVTYGF